MVWLSPKKVGIAYTLSRRLLVEGLPLRRLLGAIELGQRGVDGGVEGRVVKLREVPATLPVRSGGMTVEAFGQSAPQPPVPK